MTNTTWTPAEHERGFLDALDRQYRPRFEQLLDGPKRQKLLDRLHHLNPFRETLLQREVAPPSDVVASLRSRGATDQCYVLSPDGDYDRQTWDLEVVISDVFANGLAYVFSCVPGRLLFFQGEEIHARWIVDAGTAARPGRR